jgi:hypothetical protein
MSTLFKVRLEKKEGVSCLIRLYIIHPDQSQFYSSKSFVLQLIWDATQSSNLAAGELSPLALAIDVNKIGDPGYVLKHQDNYVELVRNLEFMNYPRSVDFEKMTSEEFDKYWEDEDGLPQAVLLIKVTDPRWIAHLSIGMVWETSAFDYEM